jgi:hypothetical protein
MFSNPILDLEISLFLLVASFVVGLVVLAISKKKLLALVVFSILGNLSFLVNVGSRMFRFYHIIWLQYAVIFIWPIINIYLIIRYIKNKK